MKSRKSKPSSAPEIEEPRAVPSGTRTSATNDSTATMASTKEGMMASQPPRHADDDSDDEVGAADLFDSEEEEVSHNDEDTGEDIDKDDDAAGTESREEEEEGPENAREQQVDEAFEAYFREGLQGEEEEETVAHNRAAVEDKDIEDSNSVSNGEVSDGGDEAVSPPFYQAVGAFVELWVGPLDDDDTLHYYSQAQVLRMAQIISAASITESPATSGSGAREEE